MSQPVEREESLIFSVDRLQMGNDGAAISSLVGAVAAAISLWRRKMSMLHARVAVAGDLCKVVRHSLGCLARGAGK